jgi:predicted DNA-binding transcriptional regulator AlpA
MYSRMTNDAQPWSVPPELVESLAKAQAAFPELEALPPLLKMRQVIDATQMSYPTIRRRIADGSLLACRVGPREIRVDRDSLIRLVRSVIVSGA